MNALSPSKMSLSSAGVHWYRLARTDDGLIVLESISDFALQAARTKGPLYSEPWVWCADVPPTIAAKLVDDHDPDQVAAVLTSAISSMIEGAH